MATHADPSAASPFAAAVDAVNSGQLFQPLPAGNGAAANGADSGGLRLSMEDQRALRDLLVNHWPALRTYAIGGIEATATILLLRLLSRWILGFSLPGTVAAIAVLWAALKGRGGWPLRADANLVDYTVLAATAPGAALGAVAGPVLDKLGERLAAAGPPPTEALAELG